MTSAWTLVTYADAQGVEAVGARLADGTIVDPPAEAAAPGLIHLMDRWDEVSRALIGWDPGHGRRVDGATPLAPLRYPRKLICAGANYTSHIHEMGIDTIPDRLAPFFFLLPPTTTIIGAGDTIRIPADPASRVDWEAELAAVIGRGGRDIDASQAIEHVAGYTIINDVSARGLNRRPDPLAPSFEFDRLGSKGADSFCPMGPGMVPAWLVTDPHALGIRCWVNGVLKQDGNTCDMVNDIGQLVAAASRLMTLEPGDVIATGTPSGVGAPNGEQLLNGDEVAIEIDSIGRLTNPVAGTIGEVR
jgi:2-keto-4-pentenoate hydratase/2-oxohepta-3-ene-1,7-dioic acid hydratase in catechol pathway